MGGGSSSPVKHDRSRSGTIHGYHESGWTQNQRQYNTSRPAPPTNLNVNHALNTALAANKSHDHRRQHPTMASRNTAVSSSATTRILVQQQTRQQTNAKPPLVMITDQPVTVVQVNRPHAQRNRPKATKGEGAKPKIDYRNVECGVCGHTGHSAISCRHRRNSCYICYQPGHLASVCSQKTHHSASRYKPRSRSVDH